MKWYNEDKTASLDLDKIVYWEYKHNTLSVWFGGDSPLQFRGNEAETIYKLLAFKKEII